MDIGVFGEWCLQPIYSLRLFFQGITVEFQKKWSDLNRVGVDDINSYEKLEKAIRTLPSSDVFELSI